MLDKFLEGRVVEEIAFSAGVKVRLPTIHYNTLMRYYTANEIITSTSTLCVCVHPQYILCRYRCFTETNGISTIH